MTSCGSTGSPGASRRENGDEAGFTLLEVLVAVTIAVLALGALIGGIKTGMLAAQRADSYSRAVILAQSTLDTIGTASALTDGDQAEQQNGIFRIQASIQRDPANSARVIANGYLTPYVLTALVSWREGAEARSVSLRTIRLGPVH